MLVNHESFLVIYASRTSLRPVFGPTRMPQPPAEMLGKLADGSPFSLEEMAEIMDAIMRGEWESPQTAMLLTGLHFRGETAAELAGAARAMRRHMIGLSTRQPGVVDTCGTGGDGARTFNISTAAAIVAAAAGIPVAKHGNRAITSRSGSADVLAQLGVNIEATPVQVNRCLDELGIGFCFAPALHPAMKQVAAIRRRLGFPTLFNLLGPLCNPAGAPFQLLGVGRAELRPLLAKALAMLTCTRAIVVHGEDGLDEVTLAGTTHVTEVTPGACRDFTWTPDDFGLPRGPLDSLRIDGPEQSAAMITRVLAGEPGPARDIVILNAAAALWVTGMDASEMHCAQRAAAAIDSGTAQSLLRKLAQLSHTATAP